VWHASPVPWIPELFSASALARVQANAGRERLAAVPYFAGLVAGETEALIKSFAGEPELHHPIRGRVKGARAFQVSSSRRTHGWRSATPPSTTWTSS
jgi:hypothetical protein